MVTFNGVPNLPAFSDVTEITLPVKPTAFGGGRLTKLDARSTAGEHANDAVGTASNNATSKAPSKL
jgi:hypothetical protein